MGDYNILEFRYNCPTCGKDLLLEIQFKFGPLDYTRYKIGSMLDWRFDFPEIPPKSPDSRVLLKGIGHPDPITCPNCSGLIARYSQAWDILVASDVITDVGQQDESDPIVSLGTNEMYRIL